MPEVKALSYFTVLSIVATMLAGCSTPSASGTAMPSAFQDQAATSSSVRSGLRGSRLNEISRGSLDSTLYALNTGGGSGSVTVYASGGSKREHTIQLGPTYRSLSNAFFMKASAGGFVYVESPAKERYDGILGIYENDGAKRVKSIQVHAHYRLLTADSNNNVFTVTGGSTISEYSAVGKLTRKFGSGKFDVPQPSALAVDSSGDLAVVGNHGAVFPPGAKTPTWTISQDLLGPTGAAFDSAGNLYVAASNVGVSEFAPGQGTSSMTIQDRGAIALALDQNSTLYVLNSITPAVTVYAAGQDSPKLTIIQGLNHPEAISVDSEENVYVANEGSSGIGPVMRPVISVEVG